jgi:hypothetical protein
MIVSGLPRSEYTLEVIRWLIDRVFEDVPDAISRLEDTLANPWQNPEVAELTAFDLANRLAPESPNVCAAVAYLVPLAERLKHHLETLQQKYGYNLDVFPQPDRANVTTSIKLLAKIAERVYYVGGTMTRTHTEMLEDAGTIDARHFAILRPLLLALAHVPQARPT